MPARKHTLKPDEESGQKIRVMALMDCVPGHERTPDGPPIAILTLAHQDKIEQPMMLTLKDTNRLLIKILETLATHHDDFAIYILDKYLTKQDGDASWPQDRDELDDDDDDPAEAWKKQ